MQRNVCFSASFNVLSLAGSNNLLTHTHSHLASNYTFFTFAYAREACRIPHKQRAPRSSLCSLFVPFCQAAQEVNNDDLMKDIQVKHLR